MNDELVKWLRDCGNDSVDCGGCPYKGRLMDGNCINGLLAEAADAIEELSRENGSLAKSVQEASESLRQRRPVVLCQDCANYFARSGSDSGYCALLDIKTSQGAFCSRGGKEES